MFKIKALLLYLLFTISIFADSTNFYSLSSDLFYKPGKRVIAQVAEFMPRVGNNIGPGTLVADAMLDVVQYQGVQIAIQNASDIQLDLIPGDLKQRDCRRIVFNREMVIFTLTGEELYIALDEMISRLKPTSSGTYMHVAGMRFSLNTSAESGKRISNIEIGSIDRGYYSADLYSEYQIVSNSFVMNAIPTIHASVMEHGAHLCAQTVPQALEEYLNRNFDPITNCKENRINITSLKIAVFSDPRYFEPSLLMTPGRAFDNHVIKEQKLVAESDAILRSAVSRIKQDKPDICLINGDLTNNGELVGHEAFSNILTDSLLSFGIKVYVTIGEHDIENRDAMIYNDAVATPAPSLSVRDYISMYDFMGYGDAIFHDVTSLTYIAEPATGIWILVMDPSQYDEPAENQHDKLHYFSESTFRWILDKLDYASAHNITVIGMMHNSVTTHMPNEDSILDSLYKNSFVKNWRAVRDSLADHGLRVLLTGDGNALDIVKHQTKSSQSIFEIQTAALSAWPSPIRTITLTPERKLSISTSYIDSINYSTNSLSFQEYASLALLTCLKKNFQNELINRYELSPANASSRANNLTKSYMAHIFGDEYISPQDKVLINSLKNNPLSIAEKIGIAIESMLTDLQPADNENILDLINGTSER
jgi:hypothetical protein